MKGLEHNFLTRTTTTRKRKTPFSVAFKVGKAKSFPHEKFFFLPLDQIRNIILS